MRLLCITSSFPRHPGDVAGKFIEEFCEELEGRGVTVDVLRWSDHGDIGTGKYPAVRYAPKALESLFYGAGGPENIESQRWRGLLLAPALLAMSFRVCRMASSYDIVVAHWLVPGGLVGRFAARCTGVPAVVVAHSAGVHALGLLPLRIRRPVARWLFSGPSVAVSEGLRERLHRLGCRAALEVIPMGIRRPRLPSVARRRDWVFLGRLVPIKSVDLAIRAFAAAQLGEDTRLHIVGDGPLRTDLEALARRLSVSAEFHGICVGEKKQKILASASYLIAPSRRLPGGREEGRPIGVLEAMASGLVPLIRHMPAMECHLADLGAQREETGDIERWAAKIRALSSLSDQELCAWRDQTKASVEDCFWDQVIDDWYHSLSCAIASA